MFFTLSASVYCTLTAHPFSALPDLAHVCDMTGKGAAGTHTG